MNKLIRGGVVSLFVVAGLAGCLSTGRGHGPLDSFVFLSSANKSLAQNVTGAIDERPQPQEIHLVVPPGTDVRALVATLTLNKAAVIAVVSIGSRVVQENGVTPNDFSVPVIYSIEVPGDKKPWPYKVFVREAQSNARLSTLLIPRGSSLQPAFNPTVHSYALSVPFATTSVRIEARGESPYMKSIVINGAEFPGAAAGAAVDFQGVQQAAVSIETLAEDGVTRGRYTLSITRAAPDSNAALGSLDLQGIQVSPDFSSEQGEYQALAPFAAKQFVVRARPQSSVASVSLGAAPIGGAAAAPQLQSQGDPASPAGAMVAFPPGGRLALTITVAAEDGTLLQYRVNIRRAPPDRNADLAALSVSAGDMSPVFSPRVVLYNVALPASVASVVVTAAAASPVASVSIAELPALQPASRQSVTIAVDPGATNAASFIVVAEDGSQRLYRVQVQRATDGNALLGMLQLTGARLVPAFDPSIPQYEARVPPDVGAVVLSARPQSPLASVGIDGAPAQQLGRTVPLQPGVPRIVVIDVTAQNGSTLRYTLRLTRETPPPAPAPAPVQPAAAAPAAPAPVAPVPARAGAAAAGVTAPAGAAATPAPAQPAAQQPAAGGRTPPPAETPHDRIVVTAGNLKLPGPTVSALTANGDQIGRQAQITVRYYRTNEVIAQFTAPVEVKPQGLDRLVTLSAQSDAVSLNRDRLVEVETAIRTLAGHFLSYTEAQNADDEVRIDIPFLVFGDNPRLSWPPIGSPTTVTGYLSRTRQGKDRAVDKEDFDRNGKGEYAVSVQIVDDRTNTPLGSDTVYSRPGHERNTALAFGTSFKVPEGTRVRYLLSAKAKSGKVWTASGVTQVWTTMMSYPAGFQPVLLPVADDLAPADAAGSKH
jgi:Cadherin-like beta sandwich domain